MTVINEIKCDRCGKTEQPLYGDRVPETWARIRLASTALDLCRDCSKYIYNRIMDFSAEPVNGEAVVE